MSTLMAATSDCAKAVATSTESNTALSSALQFRHHSAVKSRTRILFFAFAAATASLENGIQSVFPVPPNAMLTPTLRAITEIEITVKRSLNMVFLVIRKVRQNNHKPAAEPVAPINHQCARVGVSSNPFTPAPIKNIAAASNRMPMTCFTSSLAGPVRGMRATKFGNALKNKYGVAIPAPMAPNTISTVEVLPLEAAQPAAAPINGAVQGVDNTAVIIPNTNVPMNESCLGSIAYTHAGRPTLKNPAIPTAMMAMKIPIPMVNAGY